MLCLLVLAGPGWSAEWTTDPSGRTAILRLPSAPFPHPSRQYRDDRTLAFVPGGLRPGATIDVIVHYHGHRAEAVSDAQRKLLREQLAASGAQAVLLAPQGPLRASDSAGGKHEEAGGLARFVREGYAQLVKDQVLPAGARPGRVILSGHSGAYRVIAFGLERGGVDVVEVWLHDGLYGQVETFRRWASGPGRRLISTHTPGGGTRAHNLGLAASLRRAGVPVVDDPQRIAGARVAILAVSEGHQQVLHQPRRFEAFARTISPAGAGAAARLEGR